MTSGRVTEIFASVQGEGIYVGCSQTFLRLAGCNLRCVFCDTPKGINGAFDVITAEEAVECCKQLTPMDISITGGEPLVQPQFVHEFAGLAGKSGYKIHLETNGTLFRELAEVIDVVDVVAMDMKLPSVAKCGELWDEHAKFLEIASAKEVFVKVVYGNETPIDELKKCEDIIYNITPTATLVLQPLYTSHTVGESIALIDPLKIINVFNKINVRCIPQCHKILGVM